MQRPLSNTAFTGVKRPLVANICPETDSHERKISSPVSLVRECSPSSLLQPSPIRLAPSYALQCNNKHLGVMSITPVSDTGSINHHYQWHIQVEPGMLSDLFPPCQTDRPTVPQFFDTLIGVSQSLSPLTTFGIERDLADDGGCLTLNVEQAGTTSELFRVLGELNITTSTGKKSCAFVEKPTVQAEAPPSHMLASLCALEKDDSSQRMFAVADALEEISQPPEDIYKTPEYIRQAIANNHKRPDLKQIFMFGANYQDQLREVFSSGKTSPLFCLINPLSMITNSKLRAWTYGVQGQLLTAVKNMNGDVTQVVQEDPEDDENPCNTRYLFTPNADHSLWETITFQSDGRPEVIATARVREKDICQPLPKRGHCFDQ